MSLVSIIYFSHTGNTLKMAEAIGDAIKTSGCEVQIEKVQTFSINSLLQSDGLLLGSPCYFGNIASPMKQFLDNTIGLFRQGQLEGKAGGAFISSGGIGGGGELALTSLLVAQLVHGMIIQGLRKGGHLGPLAIGIPDKKILEECNLYGQQFARLVQRLKD